MPDAPEGPDRLEPLEVAFEGGGRASLVAAGGRRSVRSLLNALGLADSRPVVVLIGGADTLDPAVRPALQRLFERGVVRAAANAGALIVDGGTDAGVMAALGGAAAASDASVHLLGIAPAGKVTFPGDTRAARGKTLLEPNHTHFILANSADWGGETTLLFDAVDAVGVNRPTAVVVAAGGPHTGDEVALAVRRGIPIVVLSDTGGLADELAARAESIRRRAPAATDDPVSRLLAEADLAVVPLGVDSDEMRDLLARLLRDDESLHNAWRQHAQVARTARRQQTAYRRGQKLILGLGVLLTVLVASHVVVQRFSSAAFVGLPVTQALMLDLLHYSIVLLPILITVLVAAASRFRPGNNWVLLRGTAEAIKREIYRYRARAGKYSHAETRRMPREVKLAQAVGSAVGTLMRTDVNMTSFEPVATDGRTPVSVADGDDGFSRLTPAAYVRVRIDHQIGFYRGRARERGRDARRLRWAMLLFGGLGTFLAALGLEIWVAVTTAAAGALATYLEAQQLETTVTLYNQAAADLEAIKSWWLALPPNEQSKSRTIDRLVERAERIMRAEQAGWVQEMQDAMTELQLEGEQRDAEAGDREGDEPAADGGDPPARRTARSAASGRISGADRATTR
jgi:hypothetical protein